MQNTKQALFVTLLLVYHSIAASPSIAEGNPKCGSRAAKIVEIVESGTFDDLVEYLPHDLKERPDYIPKILGIVVEEWGYPSDLEPDKDLKPSDLSKAGIVSEESAEAVELYPFRAEFTREGAGGVYFKLVQGNDCRIHEIAFGLPVTRDGAQKRSFQTIRAISDELVDYFD